MLPIKGQGTHIASEWTWRGSRILHGTVDRRLWHVLSRGRAVLDLGRLRSVGVRGAMVVVVIKLSVVHDRGHRLSGV